MTHQMVERNGSMIMDENSNRYQHFRNANYKTTIANGLQQLRTENDFLDVTLCCDNGTDMVQAHKVVLAACSPLFRRILSSENVKEATSKPFLYLKGVNQDDLLSVLDFMYQGETSIPQEYISTFLFVAEDLQVKGLNKEMNQFQNNNTNSKMSQMQSPPVPIHNVPPNRRHDLPEDNRTSLPRQNFELQDFKQKMFQKTIEFRNNFGSSTSSFAKNPIAPNSRQVGFEDNKNVSSGHTKIFAKDERSPPIKRSIDSIGPISRTNNNEDSKERPIIKHKDFHTPASFVPSKSLPDNHSSRFLDSRSNDNRLLMNHSGGQNSLAHRSGDIHSQKTTNINNNIVAKDSRAPIGIRNSGDYSVDNINQKDLRPPISQNRHATSEFSSTASRITQSVVESKPIPEASTNDEAMSPVDLPAVKLEPEVEIFEPETEAEEIVLKTEDDIDGDEENDSYPHIVDDQGNSVPELQPEEYFNLEIEDDTDQAAQPMNVTTTAIIESASPNSSSSSSDSSVSSSSEGKPIMMNPTEEELLNCPIMMEYVTRKNEKGFGPYFCKGCGQHTSSRTDLVCHVEASHMNNFYECPICNFPGKTRNGMQNHLRKVHNNNEKPVQKDFFDPYN